jgi:hypothetical protein
LLGLALTTLLGIARLFCGSNYGADVLVGVLLGAGLGAISLAAWRAPLPQIARPTLATLGTATFGFTLLGVYVALAAEPRFAAKLHTPWNTPANAAPDSAPRTTSARASRGVSEGEGYAADGAATQNDAEALALSKRSSLFLPGVETYLKGKLSPLARPFALLDVEVAPVTVGGESTRCASLRFEVPAQASTKNRRQVAEVAARLVKTAFALDRQLQNVDVTAIARGDAAQIDGSLMRFIGDEVPVFTASIQRKNLVLQAPRWANAPNLDGGSWLRTRSRIYINDRVLPPSPGSAAEPVPTPVPNLSSTPAPTPAIAPKPTTQTPAPKPVIKPSTNASRRALPPSLPLP